eukprot:6475099-Amphidinium_carterae.1
MKCLKITVTPSVSVIMCRVSIREQLCNEMRRCFSPQRGKPQPRLSGGHYGQDRQCQPPTVA